MDDDACTSNHRQSRSKRSVSKCTGTDQTDAARVDDACRSLNCDRRRQRGSTYRSARG